MLAGASLETYFPTLDEIALDEDAFAVTEPLSAGVNAFSTATIGGNQYAYASAVAAISRNFAYDPGELCLAHPLPDWLPSLYINAGRSEGDKLVARIGQLREQEYDDEPEPSVAVIDQISALIRDADNLMLGSMPEGTVSTFYGEVNVTWRRENDIVRLACFSNRPSILQFGNLSQPLNPYQSIQDPTADVVASHLNVLNRPIR